MYRETVSSFDDLLPLLLIPPVPSVPHLQLPKLSSAGWSTRLQVVISSYHLQKASNSSHTESCSHLLASRYAGSVFPVGTAW